MEQLKNINDHCKKGHIVLIGSAYFSQMKITERISEAGLNVTVYDRSQESLKVENALSYISENVFDLQPSKVFVNIGDEDLKSFWFNEDIFINKYEWMLLNIHRSCNNCLIYITSVVSAFYDEVTKVNDRLKNLAKETGCTFVNFGNKKEEITYSKVFNTLKQYFRKTPIGFADAMQFVG